MPPKRVVLGGSKLIIQ